MNRIDQFLKTKNKPTVLIMTNFMDLNPGYSLTGIVIDQVKMLLRHGHKVVLYVNEQYNPKFEEESGLTDIRQNYPDSFKVQRYTTFLHLIDYQSQEDLTEEHQEAINKIADGFLTGILSEKPASIFTHDFIFTGWNLPYAKAIQRVSTYAEAKDIKWYHWIHSIPGGQRDWWYIQDYGDNHKIVFPNHTDKLMVSASFRAPQKDILAIPHIKDMRTWYDMCPEVWSITGAFPGLLSADIVQVYPASSDRLHAKQVDVLIKLFGFMKTSSNCTVFLMIANQWATGKQRKEDLEKYKELAEQYGLEVGTDFVFTSDIQPDFELGLSKRILRELQLFQNVFIYPTQGESFGLVGPEAAFTGPLMVTNRSLTMLKEVMGHYSSSFDFGSYHQNTPDVENDEYLDAIARNILHMILTSPECCTKSYVRKRYNMSHIYKAFYSHML